MRFVYNYQNLCKKDIKTLKEIESMTEETYIFAKNSEEKILFITYINFSTFALDYELWYGNKNITITSNDSVFRDDNMSIKNYDYIEKSSARRINENRVLDDLNSDSTKGLKSLLNRMLKDLVDKYNLINET